MAKNKSDAIDFGAFDEAAKRHEEGIDVPILGPDGRTETGVVIRVAGPDSRRAIEAGEALMDDLIAQQNAGRVDAAKRGIRYLAKITLGWAPAMVVNGETLTFSEENAEKLYRAYPFVRQQVDRAAGDRARFLEGSSSR